MKKGELTKKENTHQLIIEKAAQLFNCKGYSTTSISDIMEATGLQKGGIYSHFKSKNEIEVAAFNYLLTKTYNEFDPSTLINKTTAEKLYILIEYRESLYNSFLKGGCPILNAGVEAEESNRELLKHVKSNIERWKKTIVAIVKAGIISKDVNPDVDPEEFAISYIAIYEGGNFLSKVYNDKSYRIKAMEQIKCKIKAEIEK